MSADAKQPSLLEPCAACGADETTPCPPESAEPCGAPRPDRSRLTCIKPTGHAGPHRAVCFALLRGKGTPRPTHSLDSRCTVQGCPECDHAPGKGTSAAGGESHG